MKKKIRKRYFLYGLCGLLLLVFTYGQIRERMIAKEFQVPGQIIQINGHGMHIYGKGKKQDKPTVVFTSGWKTPSPYVDYLPLQEKVSEYTRAVVYERPGYGWSEVADGERDIDTLAVELYKLLQSAGESGPYILVGHSFGANEVLRFAQLYPNKVAGIILLDGSNPTYTVTQARPSKYFMRYGTLRSTMFNNALNMFNRVGITRLLLDTTNLYETIYSGSKNNLSLVSDKMKSLDEMMLIKTLNNKNHMQELRMEATNIVEGGNIGTIPLIVMTSSLYNDFESTREIQRDLLNWSEESRQIIVPDSQHYIHWYNPEMINEQIRLLVEGE